jgi:hypothetical protein
MPKGIIAINDKCYIKLPLSAQHDDVFGYFEIFHIVDGEFGVYVPESVARANEEFFEKYDLAAVFLHEF